MREPIVKKAYYSIGEVCDLTGLKPHVLRYWETQFDVLRPTKNRAGNRVYRPKDIELVTLVKNLLYEQKYTIEGANQKLLDMRKEGQLEGGQQEALGPDFLASMKGELEQLARIMDPAQPLGDLPSPEAPAEDRGQPGAEAAARADGEATADAESQVDAEGQVDAGPKVHSAGTDGAETDAAKAEDEGEGTHPDPGGGEDRDDPMELDLGLEREPE